jgi:hypothetical protein
MMPSGPATRVRARSNRTGSRGERRRTHVRAAVITAFVVVAAASAGCTSLLPRQYEYDEEIYLSLDGSATVYVNSSVPALVALRGLDLDVNPRARVDRAAIRSAYTSPLTQVTRFGTSRRNGRRFVHLRVAVTDVRRLGAVAPFAWSRYSLERRGDEFDFRQVVGPSAHRDVGPVGWTGTELVAFRMHLPSKIRFHNAPSREVERGNILSWEQPLSERLAGRPVTIEVRLDTQSILYRTLWLFGLMIAVVVVVFALLIWWIVRAGRGSETVDA